MQCSGPCLGCRCGPWEQTTRTECHQHPVCYSCKTYSRQMLKLLLHVDIVAVLDFSFDLLHGRKWKAFQMKHQDVRQLTKFCFDFGLCLLFAFVALILVFGPKHVLFQEIGNALVQRWLKGQAQRHKRIVCRRLLTAIPTGNDSLLHAYTQMS